MSFVTPEEEAIRLIEEIQRAPREIGPVTLSAAYLRAIEQVEAHPDNQSGADKSWVTRVRDASRDFHARAVRIR